MSVDGYLCLCVGLASDWWPVQAVLGSCPVVAGLALWLYLSYSCRNVTCEVKSLLMFVCSFIKNSKEGKGGRRKSIDCCVYQFRAFKQGNLYLYYQCKPKPKFFLCCLHRLFVLFHFVGVFLHLKCIKTTKLCSCWNDFNNCIVPTKPATHNLVFKFKIVIFPQNVSRDFDIKKQNKTLQAIR